ncbi:hypothetical protein NW767_013214 [Fusarium falciforme]|nr:hypothetical protein NW767_013214 [Fusarium falciforme]
MTAESISHWLLENFPTTFVAKEQFGVITPAITIQRHDGSVKHAEIEMEKIVTAFERRGTRKEETDLDDISILLETVDVNGLDLTDREDAVQHAVTQLSESFELLCLKVICPGVLSAPWVWNEYAEVYWAFKEQLQYLDVDLERHNFDRDPNSQVW